MSGRDASHEALWRRYDAVEARLTAGVSERMLDLAGLQPGMRVLDLASGRGEPALRAARRVGPSGRVLGIDLSDALLQMARQRAEREGLENVELRAGDAAQLGDVAAACFDAATCRWGLMYMADPVAALTHARRALAPGAALVAALWAEPDRVAYHTLPRRLLLGDERAAEPDRDEPGTFRFATLDRIERDLARAGFVLDHVEELEVAVFEAATAQECVEWTRALGMAKLLDERTTAEQAAWRAAFERELERRRTGGEGGSIQLGGTTRLVRARPAA